MAIDENNIQHLGNSDNLSRHNYRCGHCGRENSGRVVSIYHTDKNKTTPRIKFMLCTSCADGSVWIMPDKVIPGISPGEKLEGLPTEVNEAYEEARKCFAINSYTACELLCRKILMHIAVDKGAAEGKSFKFYLDFLETKGYITPSIKSWVDIIRKNGNDSTHKLETPSKERAENTFMFTMQLLRIIYEMEYKANKYGSISEPKLEEI